jgi:L-lysine cyclodeaminase
MTGLQTLFISNADVATLAYTMGMDELMDQVIDALEAALVDHAMSGDALTARSGFIYSSPVPGALEWMPFHEAGRSVTVKLVGYHPANVGIGLPTVLATVQNFDQATGRLLALADGVFLTALRTGAASAVATRALSSPDSATLGLVGAGAQAVTQAHAISRVRPIRTILVSDISAEAERSAASRLAFTGASVEVVSRAELERRSDVICTATTVAPGAGPVLSGTRLRHNVHINAVGSDFPGKTELPLALLRRALVCPDLRGQAEREGECQQLTSGEIGPELAELALRPSAFAAHRDRITVFDSTGLALEDHAALSVLSRCVEEHELGTFLEVEHLPADPRNPYDFRATPAAEALGMARLAPALTSIPAA